MNNVSIIGNITADPEVKYTGSGKAVCKMSIAVNKQFTKDGEKVQEVSYFNVEVWGSTAENCSKFLQKGSKVGVTGELKQDRWEKDGNKRSMVKISAHRIDFLTPKSGNQDQSQQDSSASWDE